MIRISNEKSHEKVRYSVKMRKFVAFFQANPWLENSIKTKPKPKELGKEINNTKGINNRKIKDIQSGEYKLFLNKSFFIRDSFQKNKNNLLVSNTNSIYNLPLDFSSFNLFILASSSNLSASSFENLLLSNFDLRNSKNSGFLISSCLTSSDQSIQMNLDISPFNSSSTSKLFSIQILSQSASAIYFLDYLIKSVSKNIELTKEDFIKIK